MTRTVDIPLFSGKLHVAASKKAYRKLMTRIPPIPDIIDGAFGMTTNAVFEMDAGGARLEVVIFIDVDTLAGHGVYELVTTIAHEATHAAAMILDSVHHPYTAADETLPYLIGWVMSAVLEECEDSSGGRLRWKPRRQKNLPSR